MRILAAIYLAIALVNFGFWLSTGSDQEQFPTAFSYLTWGLYFFSLLALLAFSVSKLLLTKLQWQVLFVTYVSVRVYELFTRGLVLTGGSIGTDLNIISAYLWLVIPAGLAMWHLGFRFNSTQPRLSKQGSGKLIAQHR